MVCAGPVSQPLSGSCVDTTSDAGSGTRTVSVPAVSLNVYVPAGLVMTCSSPTIRPSAP
jgi:hypothetical protein